MDGVKEFESYDGEAFEMIMIVKIQKFELQVGIKVEFRENERNSLKTTF